MKHSNHAQHYTPDPVTPAELSEWSVIGGALIFAALMYLLTFLAFSL
jgi:hypothetical protein